MKRLIFLTLLLPSLFQFNALRAHCQLPCGIYHDEMVYDEIDEYVETMYKGISVLKENKFETIQDKNQYIRWIMEKEESSNAMARRFLEYFLQQKIKPGEDDTPKKLASIHKLLFLLVQIKQTVDLKIVKEFGTEWENFKLMLHGKDYECEAERAKMEKEMERAKELQKEQATKPAAPAAAPKAK